MRGTLRSGVIYAAASFGLGSVITLVGSVVIARLYGVSAVGEYALAYAPTGILMITSSVREQAALVRELAATESHTRTATAITIAVCVFSEALTMVVAVPVLAVTYFLYEGPVGRPDLVVPAAVLIAVYVTGGNIAANADSVLSAYKAGRRLFGVRLHEALMLPVVAVSYGLMADREVWGLIIAYAASVYGPLLHRLLAVRSYLLMPVHIDDVRAAGPRLRALLGWSLKLAPGAIADGIGKEAPTWLIGAYLNVATVGAYNRAWTLAIRLLDFNMRVVQMLFPALVERRAAGDHESFASGLVKAQRLSMLLMFAPAAVGLGLSGSVMSIFGADFESGSDAVAWLFFIPGLLTMSSLQGNALLALDHTWTTTILVTIRTALIVLLLLVLVPSAGIGGAGAAMVIAYSVELLLNTLLAQRRIRHYPTWREFRYLRFAFAIGLAALAGHLVQDQLGVGPGTLVLAGLVAVAVYLSMIVAVRWVRPEELASARETMLRVVRARRSGTSITAHR